MNPTTTEREITLRYVDLEPEDAKRSLFDPEAGRRYLTSLGITPDAGSSQLRAWIAAMAEANGTDVETVARHVADVAPMRPALQCWIFAIA